MGLKRNTSIAATAVAAVIAVIALLLTVSLPLAFFSMIALGILSRGISAVPALGFLQTYAALFLLGVVGTALKGGAATITK